MKNILLLHILCFTVIVYPLDVALNGDDCGVGFEKKKNKVKAPEVWKEGQEEDKCSTDKSEKYGFQSLEKAEKYFEKLFKQRKVLMGDFYGINQLGYRYVQVFDRLGFIRYRIKKIDEEIEAVRKKISEWKKRESTT